MRTIIRNGTVVNADAAIRADVLIGDGRILRVAPDIREVADETTDAAGCYVLPGLIDTHTHFDLDLGITKTADDFVTGTRAALLGGTTTVLDFATQDRGMTMRDAFDLWSGKARGASCNYGFHMAVSEWNGARVAEVDEMIQNGVTSFKMYMVYPNMMVSDGDIYRALKLTAEKDCLIGVHCENFSVLTERIDELHAAGEYGPTAHPKARPNAVEAEGVARLMRIAELADAPAWVVHLSTREGLEEARRARKRGQEVYLETCPQYLVLDEACYAEPDGEKFIMSPPLRGEADRRALLEALHTGEIDFTGTDHCSFTLEQKALGGGDFACVPNGGAGVENRLQLIYTYAVETGYLTPEKLVRATSEQAARLFGMYPRKGVIAEGADADITVYSPHGESTLSHRTNHHNCDNSPFEGIRVHGRTKDVFVNGVHAVRNGALCVTGAGRYVHRGKSERTRR